MVNLSERFLCGIGGDPWLVVAATGEHRPGDACELVGEGDGEHIAMRQALGGLVDPGPEGPHRCGGTPLDDITCMARPCVARRNVERANVKAALMYQTSGVEHSFTVVARRRAHVRKQCYIPPAVQAAGMPVDDPKGISVGGAVCRAATRYSYPLSELS